MPTQTFTLPEPPKIPSGKEIYDRIMSQIEPELVSNSLPTLQKKYQNEKAAEKEARRVRYNRAFAEYHKRYQKLIIELDQQIHRYQREAMRSVEAWSRSREQAQIEELLATAFPA